MTNCKVYDASGGSAGTNVLLITLDTLRADRLGCYGYAKPTSPTLDALAQEGLLFEHAIAQSAVTPVSHASIFTGLNPFHHGLRSLHGGRGYALDASQTTLAELLAANGYATAGFVSAFPASRHFGLDQGFGHWDESFLDEDASRPAALVDRNGLVDTGRAQRRADETTDLALDWIAGRDEERPFFVWVHYFDVHDPFLAPPASYLERFPPGSGSDADRLRAIYDAEVAFVDHQISRLLAALDASGERGRTAVVVLADHGQGLGDHNWWGHSILFQEQVRVPLLLQLPGTSGERGRRISELARTIDLVPTLVDVLGLTCPDRGCDFDGSSLRPLFQGTAEPETSGTRIAYSESLNDLAAYPESPLAGESMFAVNEGRYKLLARYRGETLEDRKRPVQPMLFDLASDPKEKRNLVALEPQLYERLLGHLEELGALEVDPPPAVPPDEATRRRLEALGYVSGGA